MAASIWPANLDGVVLVIESESSRRSSGRSGRNSNSTMQMQIFSAWYLTSDVNTCRIGSIAFLAKRICGEKLSSSIVQ